MAQGGCALAGTKRLKVFVDSGAWIALNVPRDSLHARAARAYEELPRTTRLVTTSDVCDESLTRSRHDGGIRSAERLHRFLQIAEQSGKLEIVWASPEIYDEAWQLLRRNEGVKLSFTDATSAAVARSMKIRTIFGFDGDFRALGFTVIPA